MFLRFLIFSIIFVCTETRTLTIAVDNSASAKLAGINTEVYDFIEDLIIALPQGIRLESVSFSDEVKQIIPVTTVDESMSDRVKGIFHLLEISQSDDKITNTLKYFREGGPKLILMFTDGLFSDADSASSEINILLKDLREKGTQIYPVVFGEGSLLLEKLAFVTKGALFKFSNSSAFKKDLINLILSNFYPDLQLGNLREVEVSSLNLPGIIISRSDCSDLKIFDPKFKFLSRSEISNSAYLTDNLCFLPLWNPGKWLLQVNEKMSVIEGIELKIKAPTKAMVGQNLTLSAYFENNGYRLAFIDLLSIGSGIVKVFNKNLLGDPIKTFELSFDPNQFSFNGELAFEDEGDFLINVEVNFPFFRKELNYTVYVRGKIIEVLDPKVGATLLKGHKISEKGLVIGFKGVDEIRNLSINPELEVTKLSSTHFFVHFGEKLPQFVTINGYARSGKNNLSFARRILISEDLLIQPTQTNKTFNFFYVLTGVVTSILLSTLFYFMQVHLNQNKQLDLAFDFEDSLETLKLQIDSLKRKGPDELLIALSEREVNNV